MDSNHDIVPTLRMFDGLMMNKAADEIERLRALLAEKTVAPPAVVLDERATDPRILAEEWHAAFINKCGHPPDAEDGYAAGYRDARFLAQPVGQINQCDGCRANAPLTERGIHRYSDGSLIGCTKDRYPVAQPVESGLIRKAREVTAEHNVETIRAYEPVAQPVEQTAPCTHANDPKACYRVRCQLGNKCVDDDMSPRIAQPVEQTRALTAAQIEDLQEAREILENMVRSVEIDGNYSTEATCTFLRQALLCLPAARPASGETE